MTNAESQRSLLKERSYFINIIYGGRLMDPKILKKAEDLSLRYEQKQDRLSFLSGFVEGFKHLKATNSGEAYDEGRVYGEREVRAKERIRVTTKKLRVAK